MSSKRIDGLSLGSGVIDLSGGRRRRDLQPALPSMAQGGTRLDGLRSPLVAAITVPTPTIPTSYIGEIPATTSSGHRWRVVAAGAGVTAISLSAIVGNNLWVRYQSAPPVSTLTKPARVQQAAVPAISPAIASLQSLLPTYLQGFSGMPGVVITDLKTGQSATSNERQVFTSASIYKLFVAQTIYKMVDSGTLTLGSPVKGTRLTVEQCLNKMITISDNPCGMALGTMIGWEQQNKALAAAGFTDTRLYRNAELKTSAIDTALLFKRLYEGTLLSPNSTQNFLGLLKSQRVNNRIPVGLPAGTIVAHKTGDLNGLIHDAGIVYSPAGDYIITILSGPWSSSTNAPAAFADLSAKVYSAFNAAN